MISAARAGTGAKARSALSIAVALLSGCGLAHHDVEVSQEFTAGGGPPTATASIDSAKLTAPLSASAGDLSKLSSVTLQSARLASTDSGDLSYVSGATITISGNGLATVQLATLPAPPAKGQQDVALQTDSAQNLKAYLSAGSILNAQVNYGSPPVAARGLKLTLVVRGSL